ncbi:hypothetical protein BCU68_09790 [Vibrio sp. 10N.286.49.B3]|uniref:hypothetical protein n=1 Tax=Vibrio sp. 10N.286.49.B3 TaxID=1880855 RepID=UPI000C826485|nr:hypothetical protein [Vibrio sp. 10N.286.49.B3]PMH46066.1 hypothetical protein BCU68_09790 [Vibrio sp. 10N.286.49.B3]
MKMTPIASLLFLLSASTTAADHAVLNVEGEIQINGKTVIDHNGNVLASDTDTIKLSDYSAANGIYTYQSKGSIEQSDPNNYINVSTTCNNVDTIETNSSKYDSECTSDEFEVYGYWDEDGTYVSGTFMTVMGSSYFGTSTYEGDLTHFSYEFSNWQTVDGKTITDSFSGSSTEKVTVISPYPEYVSLGNGASKMLRFEIINSSWEDEIGDSYLFSEKSEYFNHVDEYTNNLGNTFSNCVSTIRSRYYGQYANYYSNSGPSISTGVRCQGSGFINENEISYTPLASTESRSTSTIEVPMALLKAKVQAAAQRATLKN